MSRPPRRPTGPRSPSRHHAEGQSSPHGNRPATPGRPGHRPRNTEAGEAHAPRAPRPDAAAPHERGAARERSESGTHWLYGLHAVAAALANPRRRLRRLLLTAEAEQALLARLPKPWSLQAERAERGRFQTFLPEDVVHQGAALLCEPLPPTPLEEALARSRGPVLLLDQVTDPRNVGAILRSAAAFGAAAVVMQDRNAPPETAAMARAAAGALEVVPVAREVNLARAIQMLQRAGYWVMGLAGEAQTELARAKPKDRPVALVLGAEDTGLRRLQRETCDELVRLPMTGAVESLNVSVAAAVALYELVRTT
ncbi:MAG TPA: 23S rRNA (guanosine(2251)-2'-O)-methyltransferase RlmB [Roseomonas sp.]|nr:23S rRNA (guanosine(2251)-2'-O)-methyltransferase RlmB [Roseomonas sp.]